VHFLAAGILHFLILMVELAEGGIKTYQIHAFDLFTSELSK
jgi:hypothetical protein